MISILHPSRNRPEKSLATIKKWISRCNNLYDIEVIVSVDKDDLRKQDYIKNIFFHHYNDGEVFKIQALESDNRSAIDAINNAAKIAIGDIFIVVSDDTDCPDGWDQIILSVTNGKEDFVIKFHDSIQKRIITMPVMDRKFFNRFGYIYNPIYDHSWCDTELTEVAHITGRVIERKDIMFKHLHYSVIGEQPDDLYKRNDATHDPGRKIFQQRQRINFGL